MISSTLGTYLLRGGIAFYLARLVNLMNPRMMMDVLKLLAMISRRKDCQLYLQCHQADLKKILEILNFITFHGKEISSEVSYRIFTEFSSNCRLFDKREQLYSKTKYN
jgi:hypothetical protein